MNGYDPFRLVVGDVGFHPVATPLVLHYRADAKFVLKVGADLAQVLSPRWPLGRVA